jgi:heterodisulfide reductase subunit A-like polyferredoxin
VNRHPLITTYLNAQLLDTRGFKGNFVSTVQADRGQQQIEHGAIIVATGGEEYRGPEYGFGSHPRILTQLQFEDLLSNQQCLLPALSAGATIKNLKSIVMIQCVGPAEKYCSRLCCTTALKNALKLKELNARADVTILYRDIRTYGFKERIYTQARQAGVRFVHFEFERKPQVRIPAGDQDTSQPLRVIVWEPILDRELQLEPDLIVLSMPVIPSPGAGRLASQLKLSRDMDGFFLEAHVKLRPVDFAADGVFMAGLAHYPKFLDETIAQAQAAASRAATILSQETMLTNARVAVVDPLKCVGCLTCVRICPYDVPQIRASVTGVGDILGAAFIEPAVCHGCGSCVSECPAQAIQLMHSMDVQTYAKLDALFSQVPLQPGFVPLSSFESL